MASKLKARRVIAPKVVTQGNAARTVVVAKAAKSYVAHRPDTRIPALLLVMLFPLGELGHSMGWSALWLALAAPVVGVAAWTAVSKQFGTAGYTRIVTATLSLVPVWLAAAAVVGIFHLKVLVCYSVAAVGLWIAYARSEIITERRERRRAHLDWANFAPKIGLEGSRLQETVTTRLGSTFKIHVRGTGKKASHWAAHSTKLAEDWAAVRGYPPYGWVIVRHDPKHAGQILVEERTRNPWMETNGHPTVDPDSEWKLPKKRSIHDGPLEIGADPTSGDMLGLPVYENRSCQHVMVIGTTGGGKTTLINDAVERATACTDTLLWLVDTTKGTLPGVWGEAIDWGAGVGEHAKAMTILRAAKTVIMERSKLSHGANHNATAGAPVIVLVVDESASMTGDMSGRMASEYRELIGFIYRSARSGGVCMVIMSQRGVIQHTGTGDARANSAIRACLTVRDENEMSYVLPNWQALGAPNMADYGNGFPGVVTIESPGQRRWMSGRAWDLSDFDVVRRLAAERGAPSARLEVAIAVQLGESYEHRRGVLVPAGRVPLEMEEHVAESDEFDSITAALADIDKSCDTLAAMQIPEADRVPMKDLIAARAQIDAEDRKVEIPAEVTERVLTLLEAVGERGAARAEIVRLLTPASEPSVKRWLRIMVDRKVIASRGATSAARYVLPPQEPCE